MVQVPAVNGWIAPETTEHTDGVAETKETVYEEPALLVATKAWSPEPNVMEIGAVNVITFERVGVPESLEVIVILRETRAAALILLSPFCDATTVQLPLAIAWIAREITEHTDGVAEVNVTT